MNKISVIVPCCNEEESLPVFHRETQAVLKEIEDVDHEFIFVDDGSSDATLDIIRKLAQEDAKVRYVAFSRNFGKESAMYEAVSRGGYDCCGGLRLGREGDSRLRGILSRAFYKIGKKLTHMDMSDGHGDFRMMSRSVTDAILNMKEYNRYMKGLFSFVGFETKWIEYESVERAMGKTKWNFRSLFAYAFEGILSFSTAPLKLAGLIGCILFACGLLFMGINVIQDVTGAGSVTSFDVILFAVLMLSSLQMLFIYILGAYVSKDYLENKKRPIYIVKEKG